MDKAIVKKQNFDIDRKDIRDLLLSLSKVPSFNKFKEDGALYGLFSHRVTGEEMNKYSGTLNDILSNQYNNVKKLYEIAGKIYDALNDLDEEHIKGIYASLKVGNDNLNKITETQEDLKNNYDALKHTVEKLGEIKSTFSQELENLKNNLDEIERRINIDSLERRIELIEQDFEHFKLLLSKLEESQQESYSKLSELWEKENQNKEELIGIIEGLKSELKLVNDLNSKRFKWFYCSVVVFVAISLIMMCHICGVI